MKRVFAAMTAALLMVALVSSAAIAAPPQKYGQQCNKGQWATLVGTTGAFASQDACVAYVSKGGITYPKTPTLTNTFTGPVQGVGALVGNPQSRVAGGITDPAMQFNLSGTGWVPGATIHLTYTAASPLGYTYTDPTSYMASGINPFPVVAGSGATFTAFFQDNCFDGNNVLVSGSITYTVTGTDTLGQSATNTGTLNCDLIPATVLSTANALASTSGWVLLTASGWHFTALAPITLTYSVLGTDDGLNQPVNAYFTVPNADANGAFTWDSASTQLVGAYGDNCQYTVGGVNVLLTTDQTFTMTATDGTHSATATGVLKCTLLAP